MKLLTLGLTLFEVGSGLLKAVFSAMLTSSLTPIKGALDSFTRTGTATYIDFEGVVRTAKENQIRFAGARPIANLVEINSERVGTTYGWSAFDGASFGSDEQTVNLSASANSRIALNLTVAYPVNRTATCFFDIESLTASDVGKSLRIDLKQPEGGQHLATISLPPLGEVKRYSVAGWNAEYNTPIRIQLLSPDSTAKSFKVHRYQIEDTTGQANQNPSDYVSIGVATSDVQILTNNNFATWSIPSIPDDWAYVGVYDASNYVEENINGLRMVAETTAVNLHQDIPTDWQTGLLEVTITVYSKVSGDIKLVDGLYLDVVDENTGAVAKPIGLGTHKFIVRDVGEKIRIYRHGTVVDLVISEITIKKVDHGSNVDGVRNEETLNYNIVDGTGLVTTLSAPPGAEVQQNNDPEFDTALAVGESNADFTVPVLGQIAGGVYTIPQYNLVGGKYNAEIGKYYRVEYRFSSYNWLTNPIFGGVNLPANAKSNDVIIKATASTGFAGLTNTGGAVLEHCRITPLTRIPDAYLKKALVEPASINLITYSEDISPGVWGKNSVDIDTVLTSPAYNGITLTKLYSTTSVEGYKRITHPVIYAASTTVSASAFVKADENDLVGIGIFDAVLGNFISRSLFDLTAGTISATTHGSADIELVDAKDGIYRISVIGTSPIGSTGGTLYNYLNSLYVTNPLPINEGLFMGGFQVEESPLPTSYIPTDIATKSRAVEELNYIASDSLLGSDISYTIVCEIDVKTLALSTDNRNIISMGSGTDFVRIYIPSGNLKVTGRSSHSNVSAYNSSLTDVGIGKVKICLRYDSDTDNITIFKDGVLKNTVAQVNPLVLTDKSIEIGHTGSLQHVDTSVGGIQIFAKALTDAKCVELTS